MFGEIEKLSILFKLAALQDEIAKLNLDPEIISILDSESNPQIKGLLFSQIKKNLPNISVNLVKSLHDEIKKQLASKQTLKQQSTDPDVLEISNNIHIPNIIHWWINIVNKKQKLVEGLKKENLFNKQQLVDDLKTIEHFYSELEDDKKYKDITIDLGQIGFEDLKNISKQWEESFKNEPEEKVTLDTGNIVFKFDSGEFIIELKTKEELQLEGSLLSHCVGGYADKVESGSIRIFSLRDASNKPLITIETDPSLFDFKQTYGFKNAQPNENQMELINLWKQSLHPANEVLNKAKSKNIGDRISAILFMNYSDPNYKKVMDELLLDARPSRGEFIGTHDNTPKSEFQAFAQNQTLPENLYEFVYENDYSSISTKYGLATNNKIGNGLFEKLLRENNPNILSFCLSSRRIANYPELIFKLSEDYNYLKIILNNPSIGSNITRKIIKENEPDNILFENPEQLEPKFLNDWVETFKNNPEKSVLALNSDNLRKEDLITVAKSFGIKVLLTDTESNIKAKILILSDNMDNYTREKIINEASPDSLLLIAKSTNNRATLVYVINNENTPPEALMFLAKSSEGSIRDSVSRNKNTPLEVLMFLSKDKSATVRATVASNENTPPETLALLASDSNMFVKYHTANNKKTPPEALILLASDPDRSVRAKVSSNENTPPEALILLANDSNEIIRKDTACNLKTPKETLALLANDSSEYVRRSVAENINTPPEILMLLANDADTDIKYEVSKNIKTPPEVLKLLADEISLIQAQVSKNPNTSLETLMFLIENASNDYIKDDARENLNKRQASKENNLLKLAKELQVRKWPNEIVAIKRNFDYSTESPYYGTPGGGEKSMGDFIKKRRKKLKKNKTAEIIELSKLFMKVASELS